MGGCHTVDTMDDITSENKYKTPFLVRITVAAITADNNPQTK